MAKPDPFRRKPVGVGHDLKDGMMWGLVPIYLASRNLSYQQIGTVAAVYPFVWGFCQLITGPLSDRWGRKWMIVAGMTIQGLSVSMLVFSDSFWQWVGTACIIGIGTALVYPTLLAVVSDAAEAKWRASALGVYRLWRDSGYALAGLGVGYVADAAGSAVTLYLVAAALLASATVSAGAMTETKNRGRD